MATYNNYWLQQKWNGRNFL